MAEEVSKEHLERISRCADHYMMDHYGELTGPGVPAFDTANDVWVVPILCHTRNGAVPAGEMILSDSGNVVRAPRRSTVNRRAEAALIEQVEAPRLAGIGDRGR